MMADNVGAEVAAGDLPAEAGMAHAPLDEHGNLAGLGQRLVERSLTDDRQALLEEHGTGSQHVAVAVRQRDRLAVVVQGGDGRKCGPQVDPDQLTRTARHAPPFLTARTAWTEDPGTSSPAKAAMS
jgi:hypothetical protein